MLCCDARDRALALPPPRRACLRCTPPSKPSYTAQGVFALHATFRWCLSGTPLQNRVGEFYSLVQFLRLDPYCFYFCKAR